MTRGYLGKAEAGKKKTRRELCNPRGKWKRDTVTGPKKRSARTPSRKAGPSLKTTREKEKKRVMKGGG